jgi:hypothetical protein
VPPNGRSAARPRCALRHRGCDGVICTRRSRPRRLRLRVDTRSSVTTATRASWRSSRGRERDPAPDRAQPAARRSGFSPARAGHMIRFDSVTAREPRGDRAPARSGGSPGSAGRRLGFGCAARTPAHRVGGTGRTLVPRRVAPGAELIAARTGDVRGREAALLVGFHRSPYLGAFEPPPAYAAPVERSACSSTSSRTRRPTREPISQPHEAALPRASRACTRYRRRRHRAALAGLDPRSRIARSSSLVDEPASRDRSPRTA